MSADLFAINDGIYFGYPTAATEGSPPQDAGEPLRYIGDRHILTYGPSGSGKSRKLILPNLLLLTGWSALVIDIKGELAAQTLQHRQNAGSRCFALNPYGVLGLPSHGWNPLTALDPGSDDFIDDAQAQAEAIIRVTGNDPHWPESAQDGLCALIIYSRLTGPGGGSLGHVRELLSRPSIEFVQVVDEMMEAGIRLDCEELTLKAGRFRDLSPENRELHSILSTAMTQTRWLDSRPMRRDLMQGSFDFSSMREEPTTVYAVLPANRLGTQSSWLRLVITAFLQSVLKEGRPPEVPILLLVDEAAQIGDLPILRDSIALLRSYGCKVWTVWQDVPQHKGIAGDRFESAVANSGILQAFAAQDMTTAKFLSERTGQTTADILSYSAPLTSFRGRPAEGNLTVNHAPVPAMLPQDLITMDEGFAVMFSHKAKGTIRAYLPDPSEVQSFDMILRNTKPPRPRPAPSREKHARR